jgi:DCN1-like protein 1/2
MEEMDGDLQEGQDPWEQRDRANVTNQLAQASIMGQDPPSHSSASGYDVFLSPSWQPWLSQGRTDNHRLWGQFNGSPNVPKAEIPTVCGGYPAFLSPQQDLLLHQ